MEQCDKRLNVCCQQRVSQVAVECQPSLIDLYITITTYQAKPLSDMWRAKARFDRAEASGIEMWIQQALLHNA